MIWTRVPSGIRSNSSTNLWLVETHTAVRRGPADREATVGAVDAVRALSDRHPARAEWIARPGRHAGRQMGPLCQDRLRNVPDRVDALVPRRARFRPGVGSSGSPTATDTTAGCLAAREIVEAHFGVTLITRPSWADQGNDVLSGKPQRATGSGLPDIDVRVQSLERLETPRARGTRCRLACRHP